MRGGSTCTSDLPASDYMLTTEQEKGLRDRGRAQTRRVGSSLTEALPYEVRGAACTPLVFGPPMRGLTS